MERERDRSPVRNAPAVETPQMKWQKFVDHYPRILAHSQSEHNEDIVAVFSLEGKTMAMYARCPKYVITLLSILYQLQALNSQDVDMRNWIRSISTVLFGNSDENGFPKEVAWTLWTFDMDRDSILNVNFEKACWKPITANAGIQSYVCPGTITIDPLYVSEKFKLE